MRSIGVEARVVLAGLIWLSHLSLALSECAPLTLDFVGERRAQSLQNTRLWKRDGPVVASLDGGRVSYYVNATLGTPPQNLRLLVDTNSADLLVLSSWHSACNATNSNCDFVGTYSSSSSSTYTYVNSTFKSQFGDGSTSSGNYVKDNFGISGASVSALQFGIEYSGNLTDNILGIGYIGLEANSSSYANLPTRLFTDGTISINGFSLYFNDGNASTGRLIFGGIDTNKFVGTLETVPINMADLAYNYVTIQMDGISISTGSNTTTNLTNSRIRVIADSGTTSFIFPQTVYDQIAKLIQAKTDQGGFLIKEYSELNNDTTMGLTFGSTMISIPMKDLVIPYNTTFAYINMIPDPTINILGVPFFHNAYTVFDYSHNQVSVAPLNREETANNVTAINENGVAGLSGVSLEKSSGSRGLSTGAKAGIGVGVALGVLFLIGLGVAAFMVRRRRAKAKTAHSVKQDDSETSPANSKYDKAELPAAMNEKKIDELNGHGVQPSTELDAKDSKPVAELYSGIIQKRNFAPQELPGSMPEPKEMPTEYNEPTTVVSDLRVEGGHRAVADASKTSSSP